MSHRFAIAEFEAAFRTAIRRDGLKVIIDPSAPTSTEDTRYAGATPGAHDSHLEAR